MELIVYGKIIKKHGLKGEVKVLSFSGDFENFDNFNSLYISSGKNKPSEFEIERKRYSKNFAIVKLFGVNTPEDADKLHGATILVNSKQLNTTNEDEYYWFQLIGMDVISIDNTIIGRVENLLDNTPQPVLVIKNDSKEYLVPLVDKFVKEINLKDSIIKIDPIEGLLD